MGANIPSQAIVVFAIFLLAAVVLVLRRRGRFALTLGGLWLAGLLVAIGAMSVYKTTPPAEVQPSIESWPTASRLVRDGTTPTLVMFAHPYCDCTKASLAVLRDLMPRLEGKVHNYILFAQSEGEPVGARSENRIMAESIPGATIVDDEAALEADRFGATTSGQVMLFDTEGRILFTGGIGPLPHYTGETPMVHSLVAAIESISGGGPMGARVQMPNAVFGCSLHGKGNAVRPGTRSGS